VTALTTQRLTRPEAMRLCQQKYGIWTGEQVRVYLAEHGVRRVPRDRSQVGGP
jgi:hypothetical protein